MSDDKFWKKVARTIQKSGGFPMPINDTLLELTKTLINKEEGKFILNFKKPSLNIDQLKEKSELDDKRFNRVLNRLLDKGIIVESQSRTTGITVYNLMPYLPGIFEFSFMRGEYGEREKKLARLYEKLHRELAIYTQNNYDSFIEQYKKVNMMDRVVPVEEEIEVSPESVTHLEEISKIIEKFEDIAVSYCYCRHQKELLDQRCEINAPKFNCFQLGKNAKFAVERGFAKAVSKEEAMKIMKEAEDAGLVHKVIHVGANPDKIEAAICNCCKDCCTTFQLYYQGIGPLKSLTSYISKIEEESCVGCGTCVERCPVEAIEVIEQIASINENRCIGCGICAHFCPQESIKLERTGPRMVFVPPPRITTN